MTSNQGFSKPVKIGFLLLAAALMLSGCATKTPEAEPSAHTVESTPAASSSSASMEKPVKLPPLPDNIVVNKAVISEGKFLVVTPGLIVKLQEDGQQALYADEEELVRYSIGYDGIAYLTASGRIEGFGDYLGQEDPAQGLNMMADFLDPDQIADLQAGKDTVAYLEKNGDLYAAQVEAAGAPESDGRNILPSDLISDRADTKFHKVAGDVKQFVLERNYLRYLKADGSLHRYSHHVGAPASQRGEKLDTTDVKAILRDQFRTVGIRNDGTLFTFSLAEDGAAQLVKAPGVFTSLGSLVAGHEPADDWSIAVQGEAGRYVIAEGG